MKFAKKWKNLRWSQEVVWVRVIYPSHKPFTQHPVLRLESISGHACPVMPTLLIFSTCILLHCTLHSCMSHAVHFHRWVKLSMCKHLRIFNLLLFLGGWHFFFRLHTAAGSLISPLFFVGFVSFSDWKLLQNCHFVRFVIYFSAFGAKNLYSFFVCFLKLHTVKLYFSVSSLIQ